MRAHSFSADQKRVIFFMCIIKKGPGFLEERMSLRSKWFQDAIWIAFSATVTDKISLYEKES